ncbi:MAG: oxidoreductase [Rhodothermales bacterium]
MRTLLFLLCLGVLGCLSPDDGDSDETTWRNPQWVEQTSGTDALIIGMHALDEMVVWASGQQGTYVRTADGGQTWHAGTVPGADSLEFRDVHGIDANTAYLMSAGTGDASRIYKTMDTGATWDLQFMNDEPEGFFDCMSFWDADRGIAMSDAVNGEFILITTDNGGETWTRIDPTIVPDAFPGEGSFASSGTCLITQPDGNVWFGTGASGIEARIFSSMDYGQTWQVSGTPLATDTPSSGTYSLAFWDLNNGLAFGGDFARPDTLLPSVAYTEDGGETWHLTDSFPLKGSVFGSSIVPDMPTPTVVTVAPTGSAYSIDGGHSWTSLDTLNYWTVAFASPDVGWAAGPGGRIVRFAPE